MSARRERHPGTTLSRQAGEGWFAAGNLSLHPGRRGDAADRAVAAPMRLDLGAQPWRPRLEQPRRQPEPLQVPLVAGSDIVLIGGAAVQDMVVVDELHLARPEVHIDVVARLVRHGGDAVE